MATSSESAAAVETQRSPATASIQRPLAPIDRTPHPLISHHTLRLTVRTSGTCSETFLRGLSETTLSFPNQSLGLNRHRSFSIRRSNGTRARFSVDPLQPALRPWSRTLPQHHLQSQECRPKCNRTEANLSGTGAAQDILRPRVLRLRRTPRCRPTTTANKSLLLTMFH